MRKRARGLAAAAVVGSAGLVLAGCTLPDGIDGDLTGGWSALGEPVPFAPAVGDCHDQEYQQNHTLDGYDPVDCSGTHVVETVFVDELPADQSSPPQPGTDEWREVYAQCEDGAADYLGADFRYGLFWLGVTVPASTAWDAGARWFGCDVAPLDERRGDPTERSGSVAGVLEPDSDEVLGCFQVDVGDDNALDRVEEVSCTEPHQAEFVGVWQAPEGPYFPSVDDDRSEMHRNCRDQVADYADVSVDDPFGTFIDWMSEADWDNGDRGVRCYVIVTDAEFTQSLEGAGPSALPGN